MGLFNKKSSEEKQIEKEALEELKTYKEGTYLKFREIAPRYGLTRAGYSEGRFFNKILKTLKKEIKKEGLTANEIEGRVHDFFKEKYGEPVKESECEENLYESVEKTKMEKEIVNGFSENKDSSFNSYINSNETLPKNAKYCLRCNAAMEESLNICPSCHFNFNTNLYDFEDRTIFKSETFDKITKGTLDFINVDAEQISSSKKAKYNFNSKELFVEEVGMEYYKNLGYEAVWGENFYWQTLYSLLFWDIIFMKTDTCTPYPMNHEKFEDYYNLLVNTDMLDMPNDFFKTDFYPARKEAINQILKKFKINSGSNDPMIETLYSNYQKHYGKRCRGIYDWDKFKLEELRKPIDLLEKEQILLIFDRMLHDFAYYNSGFPDLIIMNHEEFFFVEVKSKNDNLSEQQIEWHDYLINKAKIDVKIFSVNKTETQINNLKKKYSNIPKKDYSFKLSFDENSISFEDIENLRGDELTERQKEIDKFGLELIKIGEVDKAKKLFEANVKTNSPFETSYKELSMIYGREGRYFDAIDVCELGMKNVKNRKGFFFEGRINTMKTNIRTFNLSRANNQKNKSVQKDNEPTREEKEKLEEDYNRLNEKLKEATRISFIDKNKAIKLYKEIIDESKDYSELVSRSYRALIDTYWDLNQFEKAINTANESIELKKQYGIDYSYENDKIKFINENQLTKKLNRSRSEGRRFFFEGKFSSAFPYFEECIELGDDDYYTFALMSKLYLRNKDLKSAEDTLKLGIERYTKKSYFDKSRIHNDHDDGLGDLLENIEHKIETGKFKIDWLPSDESTVYPEIREAKTILKEEDKEKGIELLEELMEKGSFTNTVYYTLYQTYKKDKRYDDAIRVCENAIENLGYFSQDRFSKWSEYKNKLIKIKEKNSE